MKYLLWTIIILLYLGVIVFMIATLIMGYFLISFVLFNAFIVLNFIIKPLRKLMRLHKISKNKSIGNFRDTTKFLKAFGDKVPREYDILNRKPEKHYTNTVYNNLKSMVVISEDDIEMYESADPFDD